MMFDDKNAVRVELFRGTPGELTKQRQMVVRIRRIEKHDVPRSFLRTRNEGFGGFADDVGLIFGNSEVVEVFFDDGACFSRNIDKACERTSARKSFDADRSGARTQVQKTRAFAEVRRENVEKCFAQTVGGRARFASRKTFDDAALVFAGYNSHKI